MKIVDLNTKQNIGQNTKLNKALSQFQNLLKQLRKRELPHNIIVSINKEVIELNNLLVSEKELKKRVKKSQCNITKSLEKELNIVTKNHYRNYWLAIGMAAFGIPFGTAFGAILGNMGLLGVGLPIGMAIGIAYGTTLDKKAFDEGRQLNFEVHS